jgi:putative ABC transport system permease protein
MELPTVAIKDMGQLGIKNNPEKVISTDIQTFDTNTIDFLGIELLAGKNFREDAQKNLPLVKLKSQEDIRDFLVDRPQSYIINERAMKELGWKDPDEALGQEVNWTQGQMVYEYGPIIGVIKNFHQESLKTKIDPVVILNEPHWFRHILVHTSGQNHFEIRKEVEALWGNIFTDAPLNITYLDVEFDKMYTAESKQLQIMKGFTVIALFIAFLGLFGMVAFALKTRTKEIAIRRVLGSDLKELGVLFGKEYLFFALLSTIVAVPIVWNAMNHWLDGYAYRVQIDSFNFIFALLILVFVLLATLAFHVVAKSKQNPVKSLRNE